MRSPIPLGAFLAAWLALACQGSGGGTRVAEAHPSGLRFPERIGELDRLETKAGRDPSGIDVTYSRKQTKAREGGLLCRVDVEPVTSTATAPRELLEEEWRSSMKAHRETLRMGGPGEEPFDTEHAFRGGKVLGAGSVAARRVQADVWETWLATYVVGRWNVTFVALERNPSGDRPPATVDDCAGAFFRENDAAGGS